MVIAIQSETAVARSTEDDTRRIELEQRLEHGFQLIDRARDAGEPVDRWEQRWLNLQREYEQLCDELAAA
jgi:hypothetical protein